MIQWFYHDDLVRNNIFRKSSKRVLECHILNYHMSSRIYCQVDIIQHYTQAAHLVEVLKSAKFRDVGQILNMGKKVGLTVPY